MIRRRRAMTLLEVVLAVSLLVLLFSMTYWFYAGVLRTREESTDDAAKLRLVRTVLDRMVNEIRQTAVQTDGQPGIHGTADHIWLTTVRSPTFSRVGWADEAPRPVGEYDLTKVEYKIARHPEVLTEEGWEEPLGLARVEINVPRPDTSGLVDSRGKEKQVVGGEEGEEQARRLAEEELLDQLQDEASSADIGPQINWEELYAPEIRYLRFCYFDGHAWWDDWQIGGSHPLPQLVMITVGFGGHAPLDEAFSGDEGNEEFCECLNRDPPDCEPLTDEQFTRVARVTQADPLFRSRVTRESEKLFATLAGGGEEGGKSGSKKGAKP